MSPDVIVTVAAFGAVALVGVLVWLESVMARRERDGDTSWWWWWRDL